MKIDQYLDLWRQMGRLEGIAVALPKELNANFYEALGIIGETIAEIWKENREDELQRLHDDLRNIGKTE